MMEAERMARARRFEDRCGERPAMSGGYVRGNR